MTRQLSFLALSELSEASGYNPHRIAGVDEVGRGCLFGPVVAAAVILPVAAADSLVAAGVTDSKKLSAAQRSHLAEQIRAVAIAHQIGIASVQEIDRLNILQASLLAMKRAIVRLAVQPDFCWVDGNQKIPYLLIPQQTLVKGDEKSLAIGAASILAKVWRDRLMVRLAKRYQGYDIAMNKGYGTAKHRAGLQKLGATAQHRLSFSPCRLSLLEAEAQPLPTNED
ncbi:MAG: ribonuclease HII [Timaviella obliquedivisa GSE-PSE-MK23-08B]|nr:ribonuclease HII [Timaviella obliquedivisa GSE-PSE-MK23-08B]